MEQNVSLAHAIFSGHSADIKTEDLSPNPKYDLNEEDDLELHGIYWLEHLNLVVGDREQAEDFYCKGIGFKLDPQINTNKSFHLNLGQQQFHAGEDAEINKTYDCSEVVRPNKMFGIIGLVVPSIEEMCCRLKTQEIPYDKILAYSTKDKLEGKGSSACDIEFDRTSVRVICPWGNTFYIYGLKEENRAPPSSIRMGEFTRMNHQRFKRSIGVRGMMPGIRFIELYVGYGTAKHICAFYQKYLGCVVDVRTINLVQGNIQCGIVMVGPNIHLVFSESKHQER